MRAKVVAFFRFLRRGPFYSYLADPANRRVKEIVDEPGSQAFIQLPQDDG